MSVEALADSLATWVAWVHERARVEGGPGAPEWDALLGHLGLRPPEARQRVERAAELSLRRGPLPEEVRMALHVVAMQHRSALEAQVAATPELGDARDPRSSAVSALRTRLLALVDEEGAAHDRWARPEQKRGHLGGVFANVRRTAALSPWDHLEWKRSLVLACPGCGTPQDEVEVFTCRSCGGALFEAAR